MNPCFGTKHWVADALRTWLCPGCHEPKPGRDALDALLQDRSPRDKPLNLVYGCGLGLIHRELLDLLGDDVVKRDLYLGRVIGSGDKQVKDWATFRGRERLIVRGIIDPELRVCEQCKRNVYFARGKHYLFPAPVSDDTVFQSDYWGLIVPPEIHARVPAKKWRRLGIEKLPVLDPPPDGLGVIPFR